MNDLDGRPEGRRRRPALLAVAAAVLAAISGGAALAQDRPAIAVRCTLTSEALRGFYGPEASDEVAAGLCRELVANHFATHPRLGFWRYEANAEGPVTMSFEILDGGATETIGRLKLLKEDLSEPFCADAGPAAPAEDESGERRCWQATLSEPGDAADPLPDEAPAFFAKRLRTKILDHFLIEIESQLKNKMPLARALWLEPAGDPPMLVVALPWSEFQKLRESAFEVLCRHAGDGIPIKAIGHTVPAAFPPDPPPRIPEALVVALKPASAIPGLGEMIPEGLYLIDYRPPGIETVDDDFFGGEVE